MNNEAIKVIQINTLGASLSTGRTTREMHNYFINHNIQSYIACPAPLDCDDAFFFSSRNEMRIDTVFTMLTGLEAHHSRRQTKRLVKYIEKIKPDIVHLRVLHSNCINLRILLDYLSQNDIATVITLHDFWFLTGKCCYFTNLNCNKWIEGCDGCKMPNSKKRPMLFERSKKMWIDKQQELIAIPRLAFVGVSDWVVREASKSSFCKKAILKRIYNWIDFNVFFPHDTENLRKEMGLVDKKIILGVSAKWTLNDRKGLDTYLNLSKIIDDIYVIVLVGKMNYEESLPANIKSVGPISDSAVLADYYAMSDVYLNLSTEETFGKVSAEALACGTPVVAIDAAANRELVPNGCGIVVGSLDEYEIIDALNRVVKSGKEHYSNNCVSFARECFDMETNIQEYIMLYREMINS